jgi:hypothetical protein
MIRNILVVAIIVSSTSAAFAVKTDYQFSRYQVILDRMPFGEPPPPVAVAPPPVQPPTKEPAKNSVLHSLRICALREVGGGEVRVGFVNIKEKPAKTYYLYKGQMQDGIRVADADYGKKMALLQKDGEELWIAMNAGPGGPIPGSQPVVAAATKPGVKAAPKNAKKGQAKVRRSYSERLKQRRKHEEERKLQIAAEKAKLKPRELKQYFREKQMELIRTGQPALPIQLTPEMDAQLVREGHLEPR